MCQTNNWKRLEARVISDKPFRFELIGTRSDGVVIINQIPEIGFENIFPIKPFTIVELVEQINNFESFRNCKCSSSYVCLEHSVRGDNNS